ncbi:MAG: hypothetical protein FWE98_05670 [Oscillospiraceae bacterium]|nr:hypothetical protein [Oscillospiraceae bacterium]
MKKALVIVVSSILMFTMSVISSFSMIPVLRRIPYPSIPDCVYYPIDYEGYVYPLRPGMKEWAKLESNTQMRAAVQIPADILEAMSTNELTQSAACYPMLGNMFLFSSLKSGFDNVFRGSNVLQALAEREEAREELQALLEDEGWILNDKYRWGYRSRDITTILLAEEFGGEGLPGAWWEDS